MNERAGERMNKPIQSIHTINSKKTGCCVVIVQLWKYEKENEDEDVEDQGKEEEGKNYLIYMKIKNKIYNNSGKIKQQFQASASEAGHPVPAWLVSSLSFNYKRGELWIMKIR